MFPKLIVCKSLVSVKAKIISNCVLVLRVHLWLRLSPIVCWFFRVV